MYSGAENAFGALDFNGKGFITEEAFLNSIFVKERQPFSQDEIKMFFRHQNLFNKTQPTLTFDNFKKIFFPHLYAVQEDPDDLEEKKAADFREQINNNWEDQHVVLQKRLSQLEQKLKIKFSNCFESVRKAFLELDSDRDGFITIEDILKHFGNERDLLFNDLKKLMKDKDSKKKGLLNYPDFSKWLGGHIHASESFYFRHDSVKNPGYDKQIEKLKTDEENHRKASQFFYDKDIEFKIVEKIKFQWKTLRKAFGDLNVEKTGYISPNELKFYLHFWGIDISEEEFQRVFKNFDIDNDGRISYKDFYMSIGLELFP